MTTADDFRNSRFATHPDGRIAARIVRGVFSWSASDNHWYSDHQMDEDGWSPLDETRLPRVVTDEFVDFVHEDYFWSTSDRVRLEKPALHHALNDAVKRSAAPTTDEAHDIDWQAVAERQEEDGAELVRALNEARAFAARWKETARHHIKHGRMFRASFNEAIKQRDHANARADLNAQSVATIEKQARTYALEQIEAAQAETTEAVKRAEKAEHERDTARKFQRVIAKDRDDLRDRLAAESLTAREHLDAARASGYPLPKGATIPAGVPFWVKPGEEPWEFVPGGTAGDLDTSPFPAAQYVLLDPPAPTRPEGAEEYQRIIADRVAGDLPDDVIRALADDVAKMAGETVLWSGEDGEER